VKYDDAGWHYGGSFPAELPPEAGATHIGMFAAWAMLNDLASEEALSEYGDLLEALKSRKMTPGQWFIQVFDEKFVSDDLSGEGNEFAAFYYGVPQPGPEPLYLLDYQRLHSRATTLYHVEDSWQTYDKVAPVIEKRFKSWRAGKRPWWNRVFS
jgi:hypothetical protein